MKVVPFTNTHAHLQRMQTEDAVYKEVYEFEPAEWYTSDGANKEVNTICNVLNKEISSKDLDFEAFKKQLFEICKQVLEELQGDNFFSNNLQKDIIILLAFPIQMNQKKI